MDVIDLPIAHEDGSFVSAKVSRVVELIREYDHRLDVRWIPPAARTGGEAAFCIVETDSLGITRTVMLVQTEDEMDERILAAIYEMDSKRHDLRSKAEALSKAHKALQQRQWEDRMEQAADEARFLWRTPKHTVRFKGKKLEL